MATSLAGACVCFLGRFDGISHRRVQALVGRAGGEARARLGGAVTTVAVAHERARPLLCGDPLLERLAALPATVDIVSEITLDRLLGLRPPAPAEPRPFAGDTLVRLAGLDPDLLFWLDLFDVLDPQDSHYGYRDLVAAREIARLLREGGELAAIVPAAIALRRSGLRLSEARLAGFGDGGVGRHVGGALLDLDGQYRLSFVEPRETVDDVLAAAENAEGAGDLATAAALYRRASAMDPRDPVAPFYLGNVLEAQGASGPAELAWWTALRRMPDFADAWFNLAVLAETRGNSAKAVPLYRRALSRDPEHAHAAYNLGLLLARREPYAEALPLLESFLRLEPQAPEIPIARRRAAECRLALRGVLAPAAVRDGTSGAERR